KTAKENPKYRPGRSINEPDDRGVVLAGPPEKHAAESADDRVNQNREKRPADDRQCNVGHFDQWPRNRHDHLAAEKCDEISGHQRAEARQLAREPASPTAEHFEENQNGSE